MTAVLRMDNVSVRLPRGDRLVPVIENLDLTIAAGEMLALVGESGSGKTTAALAIPRLLPPGARVSGTITLHDTELTTLSEARLRAVRGRGVGVVFQDPAMALNPAQRVGAQLSEAVRAHLPLGRRAAWELAVARLAEVGIAEPARRALDYPHRLSGGQRQRVGIAIALACDPALLIADECTTGLDPVLARQVLDLIATLRTRRAMAVLFVTHDLAQVHRHADTVQVLHAGRSIERGPARAVLARPMHPYTALLRDAAPTLAPMAPSESLAQAGPASVMELQGVSVRYPARAGGTARLAVQDVSLAIAPGECLALVGASGSGKTSLGRAVLQMLPYTGRMILCGTPLNGLSVRALRAARARMAVVFQDPAASLDQTMRVGALIAEPWRLAGIARQERLGRARALLGQVGLAEDLVDRLPGTLSGGQAQRVALARALACAPDLLVLDEPTSSLDVFTQAGLLALLRDVLAARRIGCLFITHDLGVARFVSHRIAVMQGGRVVEVQSAAGLVAASR